MVTKPKQAFPPIFLIIGAIVLAVLAGGVYYLISKKSLPITTDNGKIQYQATQNGQELVTKGKDGVIMITGENVKLPSDYPGDLPQYPGSKNTMVSYKPDDHTMMSIMGTTSDSANKIISWYTTQLKKSGWTVEIESTDSITATKGSAFGGINAVASESDGTVINASIMPKDSVDMGTQNLDSGLNNAKQILNDAKKSNLEGTENINYINPEGLDNSGDSDWEEIPVE